MTSMYNTRNFSTQKVTNLPTDINANVKYTFYLYFKNVWSNELTTEKSNYRYQVTIISS